jgi:starch-binding outer membrane protein, SusD/RagB family
MRTKAFHYKLILGLSLLLIFTACDKDFLVEVPRLEQSNELILSTYKGLDLAVVGTYPLQYDTYWYGRDLIVIGDLKGGNAKLSPISSGRFITEAMWNNTPDATSWLWEDGYKAITRANNIINAIESEEGIDDPKATTEKLNQLVGEAKFLRAIAYFDLVKLYAQPYSYQKESLGVPVVLTTEIGTPARNTVAEVYDQVLSDLLDAEAKLGETVSRTGADSKAWASKPAAQALLARVYLYMENWSKAAEYATKVISNSNYRLYTAEEYATWDKGGLWGEELPGAEFIYYVYGSEGNSGHGNWDVLPYILAPLGYADVGASMDLIELYEEGDVRMELFTNTAEHPDSYWSTKYPGKYGNLRIDNIPVLRLAEMYLIRAEALLKGATVSGASALGDYNTLRSNRGLDDASSVTLNDIYDERRRELCFEGHQLFDLARTKRDLVRVDYDQSTGQNVSFPDYKWAMPIPTQEMNANENMVQNPEY